MHDMGKLKNLKSLDAGAPDAMKAFWEFDKAVFKDGEISALNKQLIAVAVALTTQCVYCIELHTKQAARWALRTHSSRKRRRSPRPSAPAGRSPTERTCSEPAERLTKANGRPA